MPSIKTKTVGRDGKIRTVTRKRHTKTIQLKSRLNGKIRTVSYSVPTHKRTFKRLNAFDTMREANPKSATNPNKGFEVLGIYKGARIMKASQKITPNYTSEMEFITSYPITRGANPQLAHLKH